MTRRSSIANAADLPASFRSMTMAGGLRSSALRAPFKTALRHGDRSCTYATLMDRIDAVARAAISDLKLAPGSNAAIVARNSIEYIEIVSGMPEAGVAVATINSRYTAREIELVCRDASVKVIFTDAESEARVREANIPSAERIIVIGEDYESWIAGCRSQVSFPVVDEWDTWCIPYTSGTTGAPKGVMLSHRSRVLVAYAAAAEFGCFSADDHFLAMTPMNHGGGLAFPMAALLMGATVEILDHFDPEIVLGKFVHGGVTGVFMVPTHFHQIFALDPAFLRAHKKTSLKSIISNAAPLPQAIKERVVDHFGEGKLFEIYSSTEAGFVSSLRPIDQLRKLSCAGLPHAYVEIKVANESGEECAPGEVGELFSRSPFMFNGYWNRPEETAAAFRDGWLSVGDLAKRDADGYVYIVDRKKDMVISGGVNIYPREIEEVLLTHPAVSDAAVIGILDERWGERLLACIVRRKGFDFDLDDLLAHCSGKLASYKIPRELRHLEMLPRNANGKVLKKDLRSTFSNY